MFNISRDWRRLLGGDTRLRQKIYLALADHGFHAVVFYRLAHVLHVKGVPLLPALITAASLTLTGAEIRPEARIGPGLVIKHPSGIVVGYGSVIGANCTLLHGVTLGEKYAIADKHDYPVLGNDVTVCVGAAILGGIQIGDNVIVGANSVVLTCVPSHSFALGVPARTIPRAHQSTQLSL